MKVNLYHLIYLSLYGITCEVFGCEKQMTLKLLYFLLLLDSRFVGDDDIRICW